MDFLYDESGSAYSFIYNGTQYYYVKNLQGDVVKIVNASGKVVASYTYDAWGKVTNSGNKRFFYQTNGKLRRQCKKLY